VTDDGSLGSLEAGLEPIARIVATVELERALVEHGRAAAEAEAAIEEPLLGARVAIVDAGTEGTIALAEPITEARLAATLARHGEGVVGRYASVAPGDDLAAFRKHAAKLGIAVSRAADGPFGRAVLVLAGPVTGPHLVVVERRPLPSEP
jgi:hypothetical protein